MTQESISNKALRVKVTKVKNGKILEILFGVSCFVCPSNGIPKSPIYKDFDCLIRHLKRDHKDDSDAKSFRRGLKTLQKTIESANKNANSKRSKKSNREDYSK